MKRKNKLSKIILLSGAYLTVSTAISIAFIEVSKLKQQNKEWVFTKEDNVKFSLTTFDPTKIKIFLPSLNLTILKGDITQSWLELTINSFISTLNQKIATATNLYNNMLFNMDESLFFDQLTKNPEWVSLTLTPSFNQKNTFDSFKICTNNDFETENYWGDHTDHDSWEIRPFKWASSKPVKIANSSTGFGWKFDISSDKKNLQISSGAYHPEFWITTPSSSGNTTNVTTLYGNQGQWHVKTATAWLESAGHLEAPFYFELNFKEKNYSSSKFNLVLEAKNIMSVACTPFVGKIKSRSNYTNLIDYVSSDVGISFSNVFLEIILPYNLNTISKNIKNIIQANFEVLEWTNDFSSIAEQLKTKILEEIPIYLQPAFDIKYTSDTSKPGNEKIRWTISASKVNGQQLLISGETKIVIPKRQSIAEIYQSWKNYINVEKGIKLFSNTSTTFDSSSIPQYILDKFNKELAAGNVAQLPQSFGYVASQSSDEGLKQSKETKYFQGDDKTLPIPPNWNTYQLSTNQDILNNYVNNVLIKTIKSYGNYVIFQNHNPIWNTTFYYDNRKKLNILKLTFNYSNFTENSVVNNQPGPWIFEIPVQVIPSSFITASNIEERLQLEGTKVPWIENTTHGPMVKAIYQNDLLGVQNNSGFQIGAKPPTGSANGGKKLFFSNVKLKFRTDATQQEIIKVNGVALPVLNLESEAILNGTSFDTNNQTANYTGFKEYKIEVFASDQLIYSLLVYIGSSSAPMDISYFAWDPKKNPDQQILVSPKDQNGADNPLYNPDIDPKTGVITQLVWVNQPPKKPFWPDPFNELGDPTGNEITGWPANGFLAVGIVVNRGIRIKFDPSTATTFRRGLAFDKTTGLVESDNPTNLPLLDPSKPGALQQVESDNPNNPYYSYSGLWAYTIKNTFPDISLAAKEKFGTYGSYLVNVIDQTQIDNGGVNLTLFTDTIGGDKQQFIQPFWNTYQGAHLKNYLADRLGLQEQIIEKMKYNEILGWWNQYCADGFNQQIQTSNTINLNNLILDPIKLNVPDTESIKNQTRQNLAEQLGKKNLVLDVDFEVVFDQTQLDNMVAQYKKFIKSEMNVVIKGKGQKTIGEKTIKVINDPDLINIDDISFFKRGRVHINEPIRNIELIKQKIIDFLNEQFSNYPLNKRDENGNDVYINLVFGKDFTIDFNSEININKLNLLMLDKQNRVATQEFEIYALPQSQYLYGKTTLRVINDYDFHPDKMVNFNKLQIQPVKMKLGGNDSKYIKIALSNYIFGSIKNAFDKYFEDSNNTGLEFKNDLTFNWVENVDYSWTEIKYPKGCFDPNNGSQLCLWGIPDYLQQLDNLIKDVDKNNFSNITRLSIIANENTKKTFGSKLFLVSNSQSNPNNPGIPGMPENPLDKIQEASNGKNYLWLIGIFIPVGIILVLGGYLIYWRIKTKRIT